MGVGAQPPPEAPLDAAFNEGNADQRGGSAARWDRNFGAPSQGWLASKTPFAGANGSSENRIYSLEK
jgi:hypothetical protein